MSGNIVITGAAGALGRAVTEEFRRQGWQVVAVARPGPALDEIARDDGVHAVPAELSRREEVQRAWERIDRIGPTDALVALAGGFRPGALSDLTEEVWEELWQSNTTSVLWCCQAAAARMTAGGGGTIVTIASKTAVQGKAPVAHGASKAAVVRMSELLADELRPRGIRVNCVLPSVIDTPANRSWMSADMAARAVAPATIAKVIAFLTGPDSASVSGARVPVYGNS